MIVTLYVAYVFTHTVVKNLTAEADVVLFDPGEVRGIKYNGSYKMCIFDPINEECLPAKRYDKYLLHHQNLVQHTWDETACEHDNMWLVNVRMLPPSMKLDEAFVIRVYNGTLVYMAQHCPRNSTVYAKWSPLLLLERPRPRNNTSKGKLHIGLTLCWHSTFTLEGFVYT